MKLLASATALLAHLTAAAGASAPSATSSPALPCNRLYVFGDSYSDIGFGYVDGNGPTAVAYAAHDLGLSLFAADVGGENDGLDFAVSGAGTGTSPGQMAGRMMLGLGMLDQVGHFETRVRAKTISFTPSMRVFFLAGGLNDAPLPLSQTQRNIAAQLEGLYRAGGRRFVLARLPVTLINPDVGKRLNPTLDRLAESWSAAHPGSTVQVSNWGLLFDRVRAEARFRGFTDVTTACAGRAIFRQDATPCADPAARFFYHDLHPSTEAHRQTGALLAQEARRAWCRTGHSAASSGANSKPGGR